MRFQNIASIALAASFASAQGTVNGTNSTATGFPLANTEITTFWTILQQFDLLTTYTNASNVTILAPSNEALTSLNSSGVSITRGFLQALLNYHTLNGSILSSQISNTSVSFPHTELTNSSYANVTGGQVLEAINHNGTVTFFSAYKNNITVTDANLNFTGGIIHIVDGVLTIPDNLTTTAINANLTSLAGAIQTLNLTSALNGASDLTIFAPDNSAFKNVGDALSNLSVYDLEAVLGYHVVNGSVLYSADITNTTVQTMGGQNLTIQNLNGTYYVNSAEVVNPDILFSGGVIHVIDSVLNPNNTASHNATQTATSKSSSSSAAFSGVTTAASNIPFTSGIATPTASNEAQGSATTGGAAKSTAAAAPFATGAVGAAALFGGAFAMVVNL